MYILITILLMFVSGTVVADQYGVIDPTTNKVINIVEWDGVTPWEYPQGNVLVKVDSNNQFNHGDDVYINQNGYVGSRQIDKGKADLKIWQDAVASGQILIPNAGNVNLISP